MSVSWTLALCLYSSDTHMTQKYAQLLIGLWIDCCFKHRHKNVLQHLPKVWQEVLRPEHITWIGNDRRKGKNPLIPVDIAEMRPILLPNPDEPSTVYRHRAGSSLFRCVPGSAHFLCPKDLNEATGCHWSHPNCMAILYLHNLVSGSHEIVIENEPRNLI